MTGAPTEPQLSGNVLFYRQPEPLSVERHGNLGVKRIAQPFMFLMEAHVVPITVNEFGVAAASYPLIFAGANKVPLAVMGAEAYLPAFVRRYPFVFAADDDAERLLVCVDRAAPMVGENPEVPFFQNGQPTQYTQEAIEFCKEFERHRRGTEDFVQQLMQLDLFEEKSVTIAQANPDGTQQEIKIADYFAVSEDKLNALPHDTFIRLRDQGILGPVYAHMVSLLTWPKIVQRAMMRAEAQAEAQMRATTPLA
jgi:hypothetical protein